jgi:hypothetical protein
MQGNGDPLALSVTADWPESAYLEVLWCAAELRLWAGVDRSVRIRRAGCTHGSLRMITCGGCPGTRGS